MNRLENYQFKDKPVGTHAQSGSQPLEFWIPYGETEVPIRVPDDNFYKFLEPPRTAPRDPSSLIEQALSSPVGGASISSLERGKVGLVVDPLVPSTILDAAVERLKARIARSGNDNLTIFQRKGSGQDSEVRQQSATVFVDPAEGPFVSLGETPSGTPVEEREDFHNCKVKISLSMMAPHYATGFEGGPETILTGICSKESIAKNRSLLVKTSTLNNNGQSAIVLADMLEACRMVGPVFSISCVPDGSGGLESVFSGELESTFKEAASRYSQVHSPKIDVRPDIIVLPAGNLLGRDLYHGVRVLPNAWNAVRKEGTLILAAECSNGIGNEAFLEFSKKFEDRKSLLSDMRHHFRLGAHISLLLMEAVERNRVQLVSILPDHYVRMFNLKSARTASAAIQSSIRAEGKDAKVLIVSRGDLTLPRFQPN